MRNRVCRKKPSRAEFTVATDVNDRQTAIFRLKWHQIDSCAGAEIRVVVGLKLVEMAPTVASAKLVDERRREFMRFAECAVLPVVQSTGVIPSIAGPERRRI